MVTFIKTSPTFVNHGSMGEAEEKKIVINTCRKGVTLIFVGLDTFCFYGSVEAFEFDSNTNKTKRQNNKRLNYL